HQLAVADHRAQALAQRIEALGLVQVQQGRELLRGLRALGLLQRRQDGLAAGDRILVALGFACRERIGDRGRREIAARRAGCGCIAAAAPGCLAAGRRGLRHPWGQLAWLALAAALAPCTASRTLPCAGATGSLAAAAATSSLVHGPILHPACCTARGAAVTFCK